MKVLFQYQGLINEEYKKFFKSKLPSEIEIVFGDSTDPDDYIDTISDTDVFVGYSVSEKLLENAKQLKLIQIPWTGFNSLDKDLVNKYESLWVANSHSNSLAIAEHAVSLLLAAAKLIVFRDQRMREGDWSPRRQDIDSFWLTGKRAGIIGYGAIGKKIAKMLHFGFDMEIWASKRDPNKIDEESSSMLEFIGGSDQIDHIISEVDFIIIAVPLTSETEGMISNKEFDKMSSSAIVVNIARGPVIQEEVLYNALKTKSIGAAGIDVWYNYPSGGETENVYQNYPFEELDNIVMSPHSAFKVRDRVEIFSQHILDNILKIYHHDPPINLVDLDLGY